MRFLALVALATSAAAAAAAAAVAATGTVHESRMYVAGDAGQPVFVCPTEGLLGERPIGVGGVCFRPRGALFAVSGISDAVAQFTPQAARVEFWGPGGELLGLRPFCESTSALAVPPLAHRIEVWLEPGLASACGGAASVTTAGQVHVQWS